MKLKDDFIRAKQDKVALMLKMKEDSSLRQTQQKEIQVIEIVVLNIRKFTIECVALLRWLKNKIEERNF